MKIAARPVTAVAAGRGKAACGVFLVLMCLAAVGVVPAAAGAARGPRFSAPVFVNTGAATQTLFAKGLSVLAADVNGDANPDLVAATSRGVCVLYGNGDGTFRRRTYRVRNPVDVAVGDVTGDDRADLIAVGSHGLDGFVVTFVNNGAGRLHRGSMYTMKEEDAISVAAGDFNGDGISDVVVDGLSGEFSVLMATGNGQLAPPHTIPGTGGRDLTVGDLWIAGRHDPLELCPVQGGRLEPRLVPE